MRIKPCPECGGKRLKPETLCVRVGDKNIADVSSMAVADAAVKFVVDNNYAGLQIDFELVTPAIAEKLAPWLAELAAEQGFRHGPVQIRLQRSRWGSCSAKGAISLNLALLFQPPAVLRYVLLHELAHTRHLNHSRAFWAVVAACEPDYKRLDRQLRKDGWRNVPSWVRPQGRLLS
jgi:hypothetical protein